MSTKIDTWPPMAEWLAQLPKRDGVPRLSRFVELYKLHNKRVRRRHSFDAIIQLNEQHDAQSAPRLMLSATYERLAARMASKGVKV